MTSPRNPQTDNPDNLLQIRGKISPNSNLSLREQLRRYEREMGLEALVRQMALRRQERYAGRIKKF